ncbi:hypothetical protein SLE2022_273840 [Rubroshorea leprosula]
MVQRKVPNKKLGVQADDVKSEKQRRFGNLTKSSSSYHLDGRSRGPELKKRMKKSRSIKLSDIEGLRSSPVKKTMAQPGKLPPLHVGTPQKQPLIKTVDGSPNYMKSTSSSEAKKESSQVSSWNSDSKNLRRKNLNASNLGSVSSSKSARTLAKTSSFKLVRSLTKTTSFKPARPSAKKCSRVALCADMDAQRATCSSTLKDSKFPPYLMLNPGGTESEGTSVMKVCPYTYCSLNGHQHAPVPPLKCFLSARRRSLKTQRSMKLELLSPRKAKAFANGTEEIGIEQVLCDEQPALFPSGQGGMEFFIEIYAKNKGYHAEANAGTADKDLDGTTESELHNFSSGGSNGGATGEDDDKQISESLSEGSPLSEIDFDDNLEECSEIISTEMKNDADEDSLLVFSTPGNFCNGHDSEGECNSSIETEDVIDVGMEWEGEAYSVSESENEAHSLMETDDESHFSIKGLSGPEISLDGIVNNSSQNILSDGGEQEVFGDDSAQTDNFSQISCTLDHDQVSSTEDVFDVPAMEKEEAEADLIGIMTIPALTKEQLLEENKVMETENQLPREAKSNCATEYIDGALKETNNIWLHLLDETEQDEMNEDYHGTQTLENSEADQMEATISNLSPEQELPCVKDGAGMEEEVAEAELLAGNKISNSSQGFSGADEVDHKVDDNQNNLTIEACPVDNNLEESYSTQDTVDESLSAKSQDHLSDCRGQFESTNVVENTGFLEEGQDRTRKYKIPSSMESDEQKNSRMHKSRLAEENIESEKMEVEGNDGLDVAEIFGTASDISNQKSESTFSLAGSQMNQELPGSCDNRKWTIRCKRLNDNSHEERKFNPREPNFLPLVPEPDAEKVDLRHQMMDERKNSEEWMLDYALRQAVTKLAPARKRKVALLVEAFEKVMPAPFSHGRPIQACS